MIATERLRITNALLPLLLPGAELVARDGTLWLRRNGREREARVTPGGLLDFEHDSLGIRRNSTEAGVLMSLLRWVRDEPRFSLAMWPQQAYPLLQAQLRETDFDDPEKTGCIFCGQPHATEWWGWPDCWGPACPAEQCGVTGDRRADYLAKREVGDGA